MGLLYGAASDSRGAHYEAYVDSNRVVVDSRIDDYGN